ncbi:VOC family protein [Actinomadura spongiicola]|uniref:VOC family protein n=1 Tax=Actinomadura spongiicola TaxID=2303421 RepID=A0A372G6D6_9ACTN|nr:VOC family protein [Actinomadura spongiicola]RFS80960.1 VOC family protein [Actinomadura spongiicola]
MIVMPVVYASAVDRSVGFYQALGLTVRVRGRSGNWAELAASGGLVALHAARPRADGAETAEPDTAASAGAVELCLVSETPLDDLVQRMGRAGIEPVRGISDEAFGRSVVFADPDGLLIQINEHDEELYT